jgi:hypothetical protein
LPNAGICSPYATDDLESGAPGESRTPNLLIRSQTLYPIELRVQVLIVRDLR